MSFKILKASALAAARLTCIIAFILGAACVLCYVVQYLGITKAFASYVLGLPLGKYVYLIYLLLGCFFDAISMMLLTLPFVAPVIAGLGFTSVWFGIVLVILMEMSFLTPPIGMNLFVLKSIAPKYSVMTIAAGSLPFLVPMAVVIGSITAWPQIALWLPAVLIG